MAHYGWVKRGTVAQISGRGPFYVIYVNPNDAPRQQ